MLKRRFVLAALTACVLGASTLAAANIPRKPADFAISMDPTGKQILLSHYKGKVVALVFILTSCPHCQKAVRCLAQEQKELGPRGFQALGSAIEDMAQLNIPEFIHQYNPPFPIGYNNVMTALDFMQHPPMVGPRMPLIAFIDRQGILRAQYEGYEPFFAEDQMARNIHAKIVELLGSDVAPAQTRKRSVPPKS